LGAVQRVCYGNFSADLTGLYGIFFSAGDRTQIDDALRFNLINYFGNASRECPSGILPDLGSIRRASQSPGESCMFESNAFFF